MEVEMDLSALIIVIAGTLLFVGFAVWGAFSSRRNEETGKRSEAE
jgi:cell division protein FtsX